jgi:DNA-binding NarL/FixJ family response regulator
MLYFGFRGTKYLQPKQSAYLRPPSLALSRLIETRTLLEQGKSTQEIADSLGITQSAVKQIIKRNGLLGLAKRKNQCS